ncbi:Pyrroline-5-carboxylate reductase [Candidatus Magnetomoraceae bacterium gMMP-15]
MIKDKKIGFIGAGNMAEAMTGALIGSGCDPLQISLSDISKERLELMHEKYKVSTINDNFDLFMENQIIILAVKPQAMNKVLLSITNENYKITDRKLVISIAAGIPVKKIESLLYAPLNKDSEKNLPIVRVMPNTPALVLSGMSGVCFNEYAVAQDKEITGIILESMGKMIEFQESDIDAVTAISGSGPAYVFYFIESMIESAKSLNISPENAYTLTLETFKGAINLLEKLREAPESLRKKVTSPGGTTEAALKVFEEKKVKQHIMQALNAAAQRSKELSSIS